MVDFQLSNTLKILLNQIIDGKQQIEDTVLKEIPTIDFLQTLIHIHYTEGLYDISTFIISSTITIYIQKSNFNMSTFH